MLLKKEATTHTDHPPSLIPPHWKSEVEWFVIAGILTFPLIAIGAILAFLLSFLA